MLLLLLTVTAVVGYPQQNTLSPEVLQEIFGTPATSRPDSNKLENIIISPTTESATYKDKNGDPCQCLPYYLCDMSDNAIHVMNKSVTGWGELDIRFGLDECQESVEKCCKLAKEDLVPTLPPPVNRGCGYRNPSGVDVTVVGGNGNEAQFGEFPWVVAILNADNPIEYGGVGVLIHPQVVMTGAHIASKFKRILIRAGEWDTQTTKERLKSQEVLVDDVVMREDFHTKSLRNDMALLHLKIPVQIDAHINVACLPDANEDFDSARSCFANGWGKDVFGKYARYAVILKKLEIDMVPFKKCEKQLQATRLGPRFRLHESFVCAGGEAGIDTCQGDGGAPLVCPVGDNRYKLTGLVAWGISCGQQDVPAAYVRVSMFRNWVDEVMNSWGLPTNGYQI